MKFSIAEALLRIYDSGTLSRQLVALICTGLLTVYSPSLAMAGNEAVIRVDMGAVIGPVNKRVMGNNTLAYLHSDPIYSAISTGMWDPATNRSVPEMVKFARECGVSTLRWPGGCAVHEYNWKLTVGPLKDRQQQQFGLPEFMRLAEEIGAEPVITLSDFWGEASDFADLVEYLNAPIGKNQNGGVDWATVRAKDGHPGPYNTILFEYGNETYHGGHSGWGWKVSVPKQYTPDEYSRRYRETRTAMKAVDPRIRLGAVLNNDKNPFNISTWTEGVILKTGDIADFYIHHAYLPAYYSDDNINIHPAELFRIAFASARQFALYYERLNDYIKKASGRKIPLAITEYNVGLVQDKPVPYRLTLGAAVQVADLLQVLLDPRYNIENAQYWHFSNDYWGMVKGQGSPYTLRPAYHMFKLYNDHLGDNILKTQVETGTYETTGGLGVLAARGDVVTGLKFIGEQKRLQNNWQISSVRGAKAAVENDGTLAVEITTDSDLNYHQAKIRLPAEPSAGYRVTAEIRAEGLTLKGAQLEVADGRGWRATKSAALSEMVKQGQWTPVSVDYITLPDAKDIAISARRLEGSSDDGQFWIRNVRVQRFRPGSMTKVPFIGAMATKKNGLISVFVVNRKVDGPIQTRIVGTKAGSARAWTLSGPGVDATNESNPEMVRVKEIPVEVRDGELRATLSPHSFTVVDVDALSATESK